MSKGGVSDGDMTAWNSTGATAEAATTEGGARPEVNGPASPCIGVCRIDGATGLCQGCLRNLAEIAGWRDFSAAEKASVLARLAARRSAPWRRDSG